MISLLLLAAAGLQAPEPVPPPPAPVRLSVVSTSAFGVTHARFFNQLLGARLEYRFTPRFAFGGSLSYANLEGKDGRAHNALLETTAEYRAPLGQSKLGLPLRLSLGYLPKNGPTLRLSAGFDFAFSRVVSLELVVLEPMLWLTRERPEVSLDGVLALRAAF